MKSNQMVDGVDDISTAKEALDKEASRLALVGDPVASAISALGRTVGALQALSLNIREHQPPISDDVLRQAVTRGFSMHGPAVAREMGRRNLLLAAGIGFALLLSGAGIGYWARGAVPALVGVAAGAEQCQDRADGSQMCYIPVFRRLPTAK